MGNAHHFADHHGNRLPEIKFAEFTHRGMEKPHVNPNLAELAHLFPVKVTPDLQELFLPAQQAELVVQIFEFCIELKHTRLDCFRIAYSGCLTAVFTVGELSQKHQRGIPVFFLAEKLIETFAAGLFADLDMNDSQILELIHNFLPFPMEGEQHQFLHPFFHNAASLILLRSFTIFCADFERFSSSSR